MPIPSLRQRVQILGWPVWLIVGFAALSLMCNRQPAGPERPAASGPAPQTAGADYSQTASCLSCHDNLKDELISSVHARHGDTCLKCHGQSTAHAAGGSPQPPPDHTYAGAEIDALCTHCHHRHGAEMLARAVQHREGLKSPHGQPITTSSTCTDCHGHHVREG